MVFATGIFLVGCMTHERIRRRFSMRSSSLSSSSLPLDDLGPEEVLVSAAVGAAPCSSPPSFYDAQASSLSSSSGAVVLIGPRIDARGRLCKCVTCTPPPPPSPLPPPPLLASHDSADHVYVNMAGGDVPPSSFVARDVAADPVNIDDDVDV